MAETTKRTTTKRTTKKASAAKAVDATPVVEATVAEEPAVEVQAVEKPVVETKKLVPTDVDTSQMIEVMNGFSGKLIYVSSRTGEQYVWDEIGDVQEMELRELRNVRNSAKAFFENNWFMFSDEYAWVIDYLGLSQFYKNSVPLDKFDEIFDKPAKEVKKILENLPEGQKQSVSYRARQKIAGNEIDSRSVIAALEEGLGVTLIEK